jgi:hypothetical protein
MRGLVGHVPAGVGVFQNIDHAGFVADVAGVIEGEEVAVVVEAEFLRIAQAVGIELEAGAVCLAAEDRAASLADAGAAIGGFDMITAISDGEVESAIGAAQDAVEVVTNEGDAHAEVACDGVVGVGLAVVIGIGHFPELGDAGEIHGVALGEEGEADAVGSGFELIGEKGAVVGRAIAILIFEADDAVGDRGEPVGREVGFELFIHSEAVGDGDGLEIVADHFIGAAQVGHAKPEAIGLSHEDAAEGIDIEAGGIFHEGEADPGVACVGGVLDGTTEGAELVGEGG